MNGSFGLRIVGPERAFIDSLNLHGLYLVMYVCMHSLACTQVYLYQRLYRMERRTSHKIYSSAIDCSPSMALHSRLLTTWYGCCATLFYLSRVGEHFHSLTNHNQEAIVLLKNAGEEIKLEVQFSPLGMVWYSACSNQPPACYLG